MNRVHSPSAHTQPATGMPVLVHDLPVGSRVMRYGFGVSVMDGGSHWWCGERRIWTDLDDNKNGLSNCAPCRTVKAFKRHLRRHADVLSGHLVVWCGRFGCVTADLRTAAANSVGTERSGVNQNPSEGVKP